MFDDFVVWPPLLKKKEGKLLSPKLLMFTAMPHPLRGEFAAIWNQNLKLGTLNLS